MSDELSTHAGILMNLRDLRRPRHDDESDAFLEADASGSYAARFAELLSIFVPEEKSAIELAHL